MEALFFMLGVFLVVVTVCIVAIIKYSSSINRINEILIQHSKDTERNLRNGHEIENHIHQRLNTLETTYDQRIASTSAKIDSCYDKLSLKIDNSRNELIEYVNRDFVIKK
jgi:hypothetical protein